MIRTGSRATSSRPSRSVGRRSSRPAAPQARRLPRTRRSTMSATGCMARRGRLGLDGDPSTGAYGVEEGIFSGYPCTCAGGEYSDRRGPGDRRVLALANRRNRRGTYGRARRREGSGARLTGGADRRDRSASDDRGGSSSHLRLNSAQAAFAGCQPWPSRLTVHRPRASASPCTGSSARSSAPLRSAGS